LRGLLLKEGRGKGGEERRGGREGEEREGKGGKGKGREGTPGTCLHPRPPDMKS